MLSKKQVRCTDMYMHTHTHTANMHKQTLSVTLTQDIPGTSARLVRTNAQPVVKEVTDIAFIARDQLHWNRISSDPLTPRGWARDCFQASLKTKMLSAPIPKMI